MLVFCMSCVWQLLNKRIYDDDDEDDEYCLCSERSGQKWGLAATDMWPCGKRQTMSHIVNSCHRPSWRVSCSDCTQLMTLPLNGWRHTARECARQQQQLKGTQETFVETDILLRAGQVRTAIEAGWSFQFWMTVESSEAAVHEYTTQTHEFTAQQQLMATSNIHRNAQLTTGRIFALHVCNPA